MTSERIKYIRIKLFMTQELFAKELKVHVATVKSWEQDISIPSLKNQKKIFELCKENNIEV